MTMSGSHSVWAYMLPFWMLVGAMALFALTVAPLSQWLRNRYDRMWVTLIPIELFVAMVWLAAPKVVSVMEPVGNLPNPAQYEIRKTAGVIESITPSRRHWDYQTDNWRIDGKQYYGFAEDEVSEGMTVLLEYAATGENVILSWREIEPESLAQVLTELENENTLPKPEEPTIPAWRIVLGDGLSRLGLTGALVFLVLMTIFRPKLDLWRRKRDLLEKKRICCDPAGLLLGFAPVMSMWIMLLGLALSENAAGVKFILVPVTGGALWVLWDKMSASLAVDGQALHICRRGRKKRYSVKQIVSLKYRYAKGITGKTMELTMCDGKTYWFDMDSCMGVQNTFVYLQNRMNG